jgi:hypothetical protein
VQRNSPKKMHHPLLFELEIAEKIVFFYKYRISGISRVEQMLIIYLQQKWHQERKKIEG